MTKLQKFSFALLTLLIALALHGLVQAQDSANFTIACSSPSKAEVVVNFWGSEGMHYTVTTDAPNTLPASFTTLYGNYSLGTVDASAGAEVTFTEDTGNSATMTIGDDYLTWCDPEPTVPFPVPTPEPVEPTIQPPPPPAVQVKTCVVLYLPNNAVALSCH